MTDCRISDRVIRIERLTLAALMLAEEVEQLRSFDCPPICFLLDEAHAELRKLMSQVGD